MVLASIGDGCRHPNKLKSSKCSVGQDSIMETEALSITRLRVKNGKSSSTVHAK
jgi:hypothetical protein